jgi:hypothetical protein
MQTGVRVIAAALGWFAIALQYSLIASTRSGPELVTWTINFFSYFTIIVNILVALAMTLPWLAPQSRRGRWFMRPSVRTTIMVYIVVVGVVYHVMLRNLFHPQGWRLLCNVILHYVTPTLFVLDWLLFVPKRDLSWKLALGGLALPLLYVAWTLLHGAIAGFYPYPFLNVPRLGYEQVFMNITGLVVGFVVLMLIVLAVTRLLSARPLKDDSPDGARSNPPLLE